VDHQDASHEPKRNRRPAGRIEHLTVTAHDPKGHYVKTAATKLTLLLPKTANHTAQPTTVNCPI